MRKFVPLTAKQEAFVRAYDQSRSGVEAMLKAFPERAKWSTDSQKVAASRLLADERIRGAIEALRVPAAQLAVLTASDVLNEWCAIATADPRELVTYQRVNCRHCNGEGHKYQWRNYEEYGAAVAEATAAEEKRAFRDPKAPPIPLPESDGGFGFRVNGPVSPTCPHCDGEGIERVFIPDLSTLSPKAAKLYAGVKKTRNGLEVLMRDQDGALANIAKYLGMLVDRSKVDGNIAVASVASALTPEQAKAIAEALADKI